MSFGTTCCLLRPERRVAEVLRYKSTSSHSFPKSNCSQEASAARLSADIQDGISIRGSRVRVVASLRGDRDKSGTVYLRVGEVYEKKRQ